jgi:hypothetical protein
MRFAGELYVRYIAEGGSKRQLGAKCLCAGLHCGYIHKTELR